MAENHVVLRDDVEQLFVRSVSQSQSNKVEFRAGIFRDKAILTYSRQLRFGPYREDICFQVLDIGPANQGVEIRLELLLHARVVMADLTPRFRELLGNEGGQLPQHLYLPDQGGTPDLAAAHLRREALKVT